MEKTAVVTDSNSGISQEKAKKYGVFVLPMPFYIDDELYLEGQTITHDEFFRKQKDGSVIYTSQPNPYDVTQLWEQVLEEYEELIYIPMSSGLSSSCDTAMALARQYDGKVVVADLGRVSVTQKYAVLQARRMARQGLSALEISSRLQYVKNECIIYLTVDNLKYLKQSGRISASSAMVGSVLNIKPLLYLQGGKVEVAEKVRGDKAVRKKMMQAIQRDITERFHAGSIEEFYLAAAASMPAEDAKKLKEDFEAFFGTVCSMSTIPLSIATHLGYGTYGLALVRRMETLT
ncbi:MAG: DegV family protein [Eubacterium sp.]|nr:DegV family protein [Eubacterium sp.]